MTRRIIFLALFAAFVLSGCGEKEVAYESETPEEIVEVSDVSGTEESTVESTIESSIESSVESMSEAETKDWLLKVKEKLNFVLTENGRVAEVLNDTGTYTDSVGNVYQYTYQIPQFSAESESAKALNDRIVQELGELIGIEYECMDIDCSLHCSSITYEVMEHGDVVAFLVTVDYETDFMGYYAYSYDFAKDKELSNKELLAGKGMTEETFVEEACRRTKADFMAFATEIYPDMTEEQLNSFMAESIEATTSDLPMYYDSEGTLNAYVPLASIAGPSWFYSLYRF